MDISTCAENFISGLDYSNLPSADSQLLSTTSLCYRFGKFLVEKRYSLIETTVQLVALTCFCYYVFIPFIIAKNRMLIRQWSNRQFVHLSPFEKQFVKAAQKGDVSELQKCLKQGVSVNCRGDSAIKKACKNGQWKAVLFLLNLYISRKVIIPKIILHLACTPNNQDKNNHLKVVQSLLKTGIFNLTIRDHQNQTVFHLAAKGNTEILNLLLQQKQATTTLLRTKDKNDHTVLESAASAGNLKNFEILLKKESHTAYNLANRKKLLHVASGEVLKKLIKEIRKNKGNINEYNKFGRMPVHSATLRGDVKALEIFDNFASLNLCTRDSKENIAHLAMRLKDPEKVRSLLKFLSKSSLVKILNGKNKSGLTPLHLAFKENNQTACELLVQNKNVDLDHKDNQGLDAMDYAILHGYYGAPNHLLSNLAVYFGQREKVFSPNSKKKKILIEKIRNRFLYEGFPFIKLFLNKVKDIKKLQSDLEKLKQSHQSKQTHQFNNVVENYLQECETLSKKMKESTYRQTTMFLPLLLCVALSFRSFLKSNLFFPPEANKKIFKTIKLIRSGSNIKIPIPFYNEFFKREFNSLRTFFESLKKSIISMHKEINPIVKRIKEKK